MLRETADTFGLKVLNGEIYFPDDLSEIRDLSEKKLLPPEQQKALNKFIDLVRKIEDVGLGLPTSYRDFWRDFASHEIRVDEKTLKQIEGYLGVLGVSYAKDERSIIVDKYNHEAYSCGSSSWLLFSLTKKPQNQKS